MFKPSHRLLSFRKLVPSDFGKETETSFHKFTSALQIRTAKHELYHFDESIPDTIPGFQNEPKESDVYSDYMNVIKNRSEEASTQKLLKLRMEQVFSPVYCMRMATDFKGKMFTSPTSMFDKAVSKYVPHMPVKDVNGKTVSLENNLKGKVSVVVVKPNVRSSDDWIKTWFKTEKEDVNMLTHPQAFNRFDENCKNELKKTLKIKEKNLNKFNKKKGGPKDVLPLQIIQVNSINSFLQRVMNFFMEKNLFKKIPAEYKDKTFTYDIAKNLSFSMKYNMNLFNPYSPVILVVDQNMKIRWTGSGCTSSDKEREILWRVVNQLRIDQ